MFIILLAFKIELLIFDAKFNNFDFALEIIAISENVEFLSSSLKDDSLDAVVASFANWHHHGKGADVKKYTSASYQSEWIKRKDE